jgi:DNA-binding XRE family transcriptional regulator
MPQATDIENTDVHQQQVLDALTQQRQRLGLTQQELGDRIGLNRMTVARSEAEGADPRLSTVVKMALAMNLNLQVSTPLDESCSPLPQDLVHRGTSYIRTRHDLDWRDRQREAALAQAWEKVNKVEPVGLSPVMSNLVPGCSQEQASACATVVQWLGSEVGFDFLCRALERAGYEVTDKKDKRK